MATVQVSLPEDLKAFLESEAEIRGYGDVSQYLSVVIREVKDRKAERERIEALLIQGLDSGPMTPLTQEDWEHVRREGQRLAAERASKRK